MKFASVSRGVLRKQQMESAEHSPALRFSPPRWMLA
jgi:hypothetical protein